MPDKGSSEAPQTGGVGKKNVHRVDVGVKDCAIRSVVVYKDRAEVKRVVLASLVAGENEIIIGDLAECVDKNSIRVEGEGNAIITDVIYSSQTSSGNQTTESVSEGDSKEEHKRLVAEMKEEGKALRQLQFKDEVLKTEKKLLSQFANHVTRVQSVKDEGETLGQLVDQGMVAMVMEFFENYQSKVASLDGKILELNGEQTRVKERIKVLKANAEKINPDRKVVTKETVRSLHVSLEAREEGEVTLVVSYVVSNASWSSAYDVRVFTKDKAMKVQYYGLIKQATGEDWDDTRVSLSTAQPSSGGSAPPLPTRIIRFKRPPPQPCYFMADIRKNELMVNEKPKLRSIARQGILARSALDDEDSESDGWESEEEGEVVKCLAPPPLPRGASLPVPQPPPPPLAVDTAKVTSGLFNTAYDIPRTTSIPADSTEHKVTVALIDLTPEFHYTSVPRLSPHSFLQAKAKNTSAYTMLAGPANIFLDNNFVAKSELSDVSPGEDFTTSLGADQSIRITCHPVAVVHGTKSGMLSKSTLLTYTHSFGVKNTRQDAVQLQISEQVPLSTDERIKVNVLEPEVRKVGVACPLSVPRGHTVLNDSHNLEWHITLQPETDVGLKLVYSVEFPQQDAIEGLPKL